MTVRINSEARWDLIEASQLYDDQELGCGAIFLDHLESVISHLAVSAGRHAKQRGYYRALATPRFPYAIYYLIYEDEVEVMAVQDCRRDPEKVKAALRARRKKEDDSL